MKTATPSPAVLAAYQNARHARLYYGPPGSRPYDARFTGPRPSFLALADARRALAHEADALARYDALTQNLAAGVPAPPEADTARRALQDSRRKTSPCPFPLNRPKFADGTWQPEEPGRAARVLWFWHGTGGPFRNVTDSASILGTRHGGGFYCNPDGESFRDGSGLCFGVVAQLTGKNGRARFVAGSRFGGHEDNGTFNLSDVFTAGDSSDESGQDAARDAARMADELARVAAEKESEYQTAWRAGSDFAALGERIADARREVLSLLSERRAVRALAPSAPTFCDLARRRVAALWQEIQDARTERAELADSVYGAADRSAFCDGADLAAFPS